MHSFIAFLHSLIKFSINNCKTDFGWTGLGNLDLLQEAVLLVIKMKEKISALNDQGSGKFSFVSLNFN